MVLRWPSAEAVGVFGSYGRGDAGVGSDLDLLLILRRWDTSPLPLATDLLVYSRAEWESLPQWNPKLADVFGRDVRWLVESGSAPQLPVAGPGAMKGEIEVAVDFDEPLAEHGDALS